MRLKIFLLSLFIVVLSAEEDIAKLLEDYRAESDLSKVTKIDSAGFVDIYTRDDIEKMQAKTLTDLLKTLTVLTTTRTAIGAYYFSKPSSDLIPTTAVRIFINDHDVTSAAYGTVSQSWLDMPIEHIDHVEVYKTASSIEFSNEPGTAIIRVYTKDPEREEGSKIRLMADDRGSYIADIYTGHTTIDGLKYFLYAHSDDKNRKKYENMGADLLSDSSEKYLYASFEKRGWRGELSFRTKNKDNFLGLGRFATPHDTDSTFRQIYFHLSKTFDNAWRLQLSYDYMKVDRMFDDPGGIAAGAAGIVQYYNINIKDSVFSIIFDRRKSYGRHDLLYGGFMKFKKMHQYGTFDTVETDFSVGTKLFSVYFEDKYNINDTTTLIGSLKGDVYRYDNVKERKRLTARVGAIKKTGAWEFRTFLTKMYVPAESYKLYNPYNTPYISNPNLMYPDIKMAMFGTKYSKNRHEIEARASFHAIRHPCIISPTGVFINYPGTVRRAFYTLKYKYKIDPHNRIGIDIFKGSNSMDVELSPDYGAVFQAYNRYKNFDFYNQLIYRCAYDYFGVEVDSSIDYTAAIKYRYSDSLSIGIRGENLFDEGYEQAYRNLDFPIPVFDRKIWINMEYLF